MYFYIYRDRQGGWRWRLYAANERKIATSGEGYVSKAHCLRMVRVVATKTQGIPVRYGPSARSG